MPCLSKHVQKVIIAPSITIKDHNNQALLNQDTVYRGYTRAFWNLVMKLFLGAVLTTRKLGIHATEALCLRRAFPGKDR
jgi:hypothetical protein